MKHLAAILAGSVVCAFVTYLLFDVLGAFGLMGNRVTVDVTVFVLFLAMLATGAGAMGILVLRLLENSEHRRFAAIEARLQELERASPPGPKPPTASA